MDENTGFVIGREMAAAHEAEARRRAGGPPPSPLPRTGYDAARGDLGLLSIEPIPLDAALSAFARAYQSSDAGRRAELRAGVSLDDAYTLLAYARRASVFALRSGEARLVEDGLVACAAIGYDRIDIRDGLVAMALLHHAAVRCGSDPSEQLRAAGRMGEPAYAGLIEDFLARPAPDHDLRKAWGYSEVEGPYGPGLLASGHGRWEPTVDLVGISLRAAAALRGDEYLIDEPMLAVELPAIWLSRDGDATLAPTLARVHATVVVHARHQPPPPAVPDRQQLTTWVLEAASPADARRLSDLARSPRPGDALLGLAEGALFVLVVARSAVVGVPAVEDGDRLIRFEAGLRAALVP